MGDLEEKIMAPEAEPDKISAIVSELSSDTVQAPRALSQPLLQRLRQVADINGGKVPLHGRLFAQWMHHAFPRECPYPHEVGTTTPATPDEWIEKTGAADSQASTEEMMRHVESDTCSSDAPHDCADETPDLPWSDAEQLLNVAVRPARQTPTRWSMSSVLVTLSFISVVIGGLTVVSLRTSVATRLRLRFQTTLPGFNNKRRAQGQLAGWQQMLLFFAALLLAVMLDLLDWSVFLCTLCGGILVAACRSRVLKDIAKVFGNMPRLACSKEADPEFSKCCV